MENDDGLDNINRDSDDESYISDGSDNESYISDGSDNESYKSTSNSESSDDESNNIELPVANYKHEILQAVRDNQVVIITGKTGCGKTTQVPQYLLDAGLNNKGIIGLTQPRRICAVSIAKRIAKERRCFLGREVGYQIRFDTRISSVTRIKVMTEGVLLNDFRSDKKLRDYGVIIIDEVHERSTICDILLGLLKTIVAKRSDLRIIICSATINIDKMSWYFGNVGVVEITGRPHPIEIIYNACFIPDYISVIVEIIKKHINIKSTMNAGYPCDILIFIPGVSTVLKCCRELDKYLECSNIKDVFLYPLYAGIGIDAQKHALKAVGPHQRKIVISTNIAESSLTIEGIKIVIDTGLFKKRSYIPRLDIDSLYDASISKTQAEQRSGRAGRTSPGICYRLYTEASYNDLSDDNTPAIQRDNLANLYLTMITLDLDPRAFDYFDHPQPYRLNYAEDELRFHSLTDENNKLTPIGNFVAELPIELRLAKVIQTSIGKDCLYSVMCICALLTEEYVFLRPWKEIEFIKSQQKQRKFYNRDGDHFTLMNLYLDWKVQENQKRWCHKYYINLPIMKEVDMIVAQIHIALSRKNIVLTRSFIDDRIDIKISFISVFYRNICFSYVFWILKIYDGRMYYISKYSKHRSTNTTDQQYCLYIKGVLIFGDLENHYSVNNIMTVEQSLLPASVNELTNNYGDYDDIDFDVFDFDVILLYEIGFYDDKFDDF